jgi:hypothetical protein
MDVLCDMFAAKVMTNNVLQPQWRQWRLGEGVSHMDHTAEQQQSHTVATKIWCCMCPQNTWQWNITRRDTIVVCIFAGVVQDEKLYLMMDVWHRHLTFPYHTSWWCLNMLSMGFFFLRLISHKEGIYVNVNNVAGGGNSQVHDCTKHSHNAHTASCKARPHPLGPQALPCHPAPPAPVSCSVWLWCRLQCCPWQASASACLSLSPWLGLKGIVSNILLTSAHKHLHMGESNQSVGGTDIRFRLPSPSPTTQAAVCTGPLPLRFWQDNISPIPTLSICRKRDR